MFHKSKKFCLVWSISCLVLQKEDNSIQQLPLWLPVILQVQDLKFWLSYSSLNWINKITFTLTPFLFNLANIIFQINLERRPLNKLTTASAKSEAFLNKCYSRPVSALPTLNFDKVNRCDNLDGWVVPICAIWQMDDSDNRSDRPFSAGYQPKKFRYLSKNYNESSLESLDGNAKIFQFYDFTKITKFLNMLYRRHSTFFQLVQESLFGKNKKLVTWQHS